MGTQRSTDEIVVIRCAILHLRWDCRAQPRIFLHDEVQNFTGATHMQDMRNGSMKGEEYGVGESCSIW